MIKSFHICTAPGSCPYDPDLREDVTSISCKECRYYELDEQARLVHLRLERETVHRRWMTTECPTFRRQHFDHYKRLDQEIRELVAEIAKTKNNPQ